ncbi:uncharacterized protein METZ01_LOCUS395186, partial [marine metagenome]
QPTNKLYKILSLCIIISTESFSVS